MKSRLKNQRVATVLAASVAICVALLASPNAGAVTSTPTTPAVVANPIRHVVVIFQENHSFDDALGAYCTAVAAGTIQRSGLNNGCDGLTHATTMPGSPLLRTMPDVVPLIYHSVKAQRDAIDAGKMDGWLKVTGCTTGACLAQRPPAQSPNLTALANGFALSDRTFEHSTSPSWVGHIEVVAATKAGFFGNNPWYRAGPGVPPQGLAWGCDSNNVAQYGNLTTMVPSCVPDPTLPVAKYPYGGAFGPTPVKYVPTIMNRLNGAGLTWKLYAGGGPITASQPKPAGYGWTICPAFAQCLYTQQSKGFVPNSQVLTAAKNGTLPSFSVVTPTNVQSQHNSNSWTAGDNWIGQVVSAIEHGPNWSSTAIFITWDDCGCFYDHVNPLLYGRDWGVRVPMVIVSPYARAGYTDSMPTTFSGILAYTEHTFGLTPLNTSDASAYDFKNSFDYSQTPLTIKAMVTTPILASSKRWIAAHPANKNDPT
jgi:phospholipase C